MTMSRKLKARYGRLQVLATPVEQTPGVRRKVWVRCRCGTKKLVLVDALKSGRTKSCGFRPCRKGRRIRIDRQYRPYGSSLEDAKIRQVWRALDKDRRKVSDVAQGFALKESFVHSLVRAIKRCGGVTRYLKLVNERRATK